MQQPCPTFALQVGICGSVHGIELHESNVSFARDASKLCARPSSSPSAVLEANLVCILSADFISNQARQIALIAVLSRALSRVPDIHMRQRVRYARRTEVSDKRTKVRLYRAICDNVALRRAVKMCDSYSAV